MKLSLIIGSVLLLGCHIDYILASAALSHDLLSLGLITKSKALIGPVVSSMLAARTQTPGLAGQSSVQLLLRFAETLAVSGDIPQRYVVF